MNAQRGHTFTAARSAGGSGGLRPAGETRREAEAPAPERGAAPAERDRERALERDRGRPPERPGGNGVAIAALIVGLLALIVLVLSLGTLFPVSLVLGIGAVVLGVIGRRKANRGAGPSGRRGGHGGKALAGLWLGVLTALLSIALPVIAIAALSGDSDLRRSVEDLTRGEEIEQPVPEED